MTNLLLHVFMETSLLNYSSQGVSKLPGLGYTDMQEFCMHALTFNNFTSFTYWQRTTLAAGRCYRGRGLIDSTAESASYMLTRDNHVLRVMSRCESNKSQTRTFENHANLLAYLAS